MIVPGITRAASHALSANAIAVVVSLATTVIVARSLGPMEKGRFDLMTAAAGLLSLVLSLSIPSGITYAVARGLADVGPLTRRAIPIVLAQAIATVSILSILSGSGGADFLLPAGSPINAQIAIAILVACVSLSAVFKAVLLGQERYAAANWRDLSGRVAVLAAVGLMAAVSLARGQHPVATEVVWAVIIGTAVGAVILHQASRQAAAGEGSAALRTIVSFALPSYAANIIQFLNYRLDLFLVGFFRGAAEVGLYALAATIGQLIWLLSNSIASVLFPSVAGQRRSPRDAALRTALVARYTLFASIVGATMLAFGSRLLIGTMYGPEFLQATIPLLLLLPGITVLAPASILAAHLAGVGRPGMNLLASTVGFAATVVLDIALIPAFGMAGAAIASSVSYSIAAVATATIYIRIEPISMTDLLVPRRRDLKAIERAIKVLRG